MINLFEETNDEFEKLEETKKRVMGGINERHEELNKALNEIMSKVYEEETHETVNAIHEEKTNESRSKEIDQLFDEIDKILDEMLY